MERSVRDMAPLVKLLLGTVGAEAQKQGVNAFAVGGYVRDLLLGRPNLDVDIVVEGDGVAFARALATTLNARVAEVPRFGTAHIYLDERQEGMPTRVDVATARRERYEHPGALPVVEQASLRADLYRRDFSINALALRLGPDGPTDLIDLFGGLRDLKARRIRILHPLSFVDDPTRILRAVRFATRYGFALDPQTLELARQAAAQGALHHVSMERLRGELVLLLAEVRSGLALQRLQDLGVLARLLPGVNVDQELAKLINAVDQLPAQAGELAAEAEPWMLKLLVALHRLEAPEAIRLTGRLKLRRGEAQRLRAALAGWRAALTAAKAPHCPPATAVQALNGLPPEGLLLLCLMGAAPTVLRFWTDWRNVKLNITGRDLTDAGVAAGSVVGRVLARVLADRLGGHLPDRASQLDRALRYANEEAEPC